MVLYGATEIVFRNGISIAWDEQSKHHTRFLLHKIIIILMMASFKTFVIDDHVAMSYRDIVIWEHTVLQRIVEPPEVSVTLYTVELIILFQHPDTSVYIQSPEMGTLLYTVKLCYSTH